MSARRGSDGLRLLQQELQAMGWEQKGLTRRGHLIWAHPRVGQLLITPPGGTSRRSLENNLATAKRLLRRAQEDQHARTP